MELLSAKGVTKQFGGLTALDGIDLSLKAGEIVSVIGPNGAGKTTLFNVLTGFYPLDAGVIEFSGERIDDLPVIVLPNAASPEPFKTFDSSVP
jgi:branched-chain amino acid transport system ATP-binding protein